MNKVTAKSKHNVLIEVMNTEFFLATHIKQNCNKSAISHRIYISALYGLITSVMVQIHGILWFRLKLIYVVWLCQTRLIIMYIERQRKDKQFNVTSVSRKDTIRLWYSLVDSLIKTAFIAYEIPYLNGDPLYI